MKLPICLILLLCAAEFAGAQSTPPNEPKDSVVWDTAKVNAIAKSSLDDKTSIKFEIESTFPGGPAAWIQFLAAHFKYPKQAAKEHIEGKVIVQFIVDKDGSVINIHAVSGPDLLREAAEEIIKQSPRWTPAIQNGKVVKSYKKQPFIYKIDK